MKRVSLAPLVTLFALALSSSAVANSVTLTLESEHQNHYYAGIGHRLYGPTKPFESDAGFIYKSMLSGSLTNHDHGFGFHDGPTTEASYVTLAQASPNSAHAALMLYTPPKGSPDCNPHALVAYNPVPEPGSLTLIGTGLIGLAAIIRRKFAAV